MFDGRANDHLHVAHWIAFFLGDDTWMLDVICLHCGRSRAAGNRIFTDFAECH